MIVITPRQTRCKAGRPIGYRQVDCAPLPAQTPTTPMVAISNCVAFGSPIPRVVGPVGGMGNKYSKLQIQTPTWPTMPSPDRLGLFVNLCEQMTMKFMPKPRVACRNETIEVQSRMPARPAQPRLSGPGRWYAKCRTKSNYWRHLTDQSAAFTFLHRAGRECYYKQNR